MIRLGGKKVYFRKNGKVQTGTIDGSADSLSVYVNIEERVKRDGEKAKMVKDSCPVPLRMLFEDRKLVGKGK